MFQVVEKRKRKQSRICNTDSTKHIQVIGQTVAVCIGKRITDNKEKLKEVV